ncbi:MAG: prolipoprotein diacylglyceryl transferase [Rickettsiales bacterium]|jgi:phosphatidylglycerol:prolipoprotein diacylglycerol transferase|nr:prolipoprotein diacylglyceryl transferase [Rickettsiales bacterium]
MILNATNLNPNAFEFFGFSVKWYGLAYAIAFLLAYYLLVYLTKKEHSEKMTPKFWDGFLLYAILGIILGGRLGYVLFYNFPQYLANPLEIFAVWKGGMSFHGGGLGLLTGAYLFSKKENVKFFNLADYLMLAAPIGLFFGRIANFINQELYGKFTDGSWGVIFNGETNPRYPTQLFEAFFEGIVLFIVMLVLYKKTNVMKKHGMMTGIFFILYAIFRSSVEFFRLPDVQLGYLLGTNWLTMGMVLCIPMLLIGIGLVWMSGGKK